jgi:hypothetical protein
MENKNIIDFLFDKKEEDNLFSLDDIELDTLKNKVEIVENEILKFIDKRVHPKSRKKLRRLLLNYNNAIFISAAKENELYYKYGVSDGAKFITSALSIK